MLHQKRLPNEHSQSSAAYFCLLLISIYIQSSYVIPHYETDNFFFRHDIENFKLEESKLDLSFNRCDEMDFQSQIEYQDKNQFSDDNLNLYQFWRYEYEEDYGYLEKIEKKIKPNEEFKQSQYLDNYNDIISTEDSNSKVEKPKKSKGIKSIIMTQQLRQLIDFTTQTKIQQDYISKGLQLQENEWKTMKQKKLVNRALKNVNKLSISKLESWDVHLKSLRSHYLQNIFSNFGGSLWKVPSQKLLKEYAFASNDNKLNLIKYLEKQRERVSDVYYNFEMKREFYLNAIEQIIQALQLAYDLQSSSDDIIFEILFKVQIGSLFE